MYFTVIPQSDSIGQIPVNSLKDAIGVKHCLLAYMGTLSTIEDKEGYIVSDKVQSSFIVELFFK